MIFVIRHGERADDAGVRDDLLKPFDPHLTNHGKEQARVTGFEISKSINEAIQNGLIKTKNPEIILISSPYLRCLETAENLVPGLTKFSIKENSIFVDDGMAEFQGEVFFDGPHIDQLHFRTDKQDELRKKIDMNLVDGFIEKKKHSVIPKFPEVQVDFFERAKEAFWNIYDHYNNNLNQKEDKILIIVTHGFMTRAILGVNHYITSKGTEYCCLSQLYYPDKSTKKAKILTSLDYRHLLVLNQKPKL